MLEIIIVWRLAVRIGATAEKKGLKKFLYQLMAVALWFLGEFTGGIIGSALFGDKASFWLKYIPALVCAICGALLAFLILYLVPDLSIITEKPTAFTGLRIFARTGWFPVLVILIMVTCSLLTLGGAVLLLVMRSGVARGNLLF